MTAIYSIHLGDCLPAMQAMADKSIDCVVTDPPYGIDICGIDNKFGVATNTSRKATGQTWDNAPPGKEIFDEIFRVSRNQIIFGANYFLEYLYSSPCYIVWDKRGNLPQVPFAPTEWAWIFFDRMPKKYTVINHGFIRDSPEIKTGHPTQKPLLLMEQIIHDFTDEGNTILDPFVGSGTTGVAAILTNRNFIGMELDPIYFAICQSRLANAAYTAAGRFLPVTGTDADLDSLPLFFVE